MQSALPISASEVVLALAGLFSMGLNWRFAASISSMKLEIKAESDALRREISDKLDKLRIEFVPDRLAAEQRSSFERRIDNLEEEVKRNRENLHNLSNKLTELAIGPLQTINTALTEKARRMGIYEERLRVFEDQIRDIEESINDIERRKS